MSDAGASGPQLPSRPSKGAVKGGKPSKALKKKNAKKKGRGPSQQARDEDAIDVGPRSFVFARKDPPTVLKTLVADWKKVMLPNCALKLKALKRNTVKDFRAAASTWRVSHFQVFYAAESATTLRLMRFPMGPTLSLRILSFTTAREVIARARAAHRGIAGSATLFQTPPVLVLNGFRSSEPHVALLAETLQSLFPPVVVDEIKLAACRRVLLWHRHADGTIDVRHYAIVARSAAAASRGVRRLVSGGSRAVPRKIGTMADVADIVTRADAYSDAESDAEAITVDAPQSLNANVAEDTATTIKLIELGPRMTVTLQRVTEGFWDEGDALFETADAIPSAPVRAAGAVARAAAFQPLPEEDVASRVHAAVAEVEALDAAGADAKALAAAQAAVIAARKEAAAKASEVAAKFATAAPADTDLRPVAADTLAPAGAEYQHKSKRAPKAPKETPVAKRARL